MSEHLKLSFLIVVISSLIWSVCSTAIRPVRFLQAECAITARAPAATRRCGKRLLALAHLDTRAVHRLGSCSIRHHVKTPHRIPCNRAWRADATIAEPSATTATAESAEIAVSAQLLPHRSARLLRCRHPSELPYIPVRQPVRGDRCVPARGMHRTRLPGRANLARPALPKDPQPRESRLLHGALSVSRLRWCGFFGMGDQLLECY